MSKEGGSEEGGFLSRWSRRKRGLEVAEPTPKPVPESVPKPVAEPVAAAPEPVPAPEPEPEPEFDPATLPDIETLTAESDFSAFLKKGVPEALKRLAMRRAWSLDPAIRDFIGPADYAWDFNAPDGVPGFALELGGDAKRLLAHAVGQLEEYDAALAKERGEAPPEPEPEPVIAEPEPVSEEEEPPLEPIRLSMPEVETPPPAPPAPAERPAPARRRHGGALPE
ncbi:DUF3306 domain-containing protein [Rhodovarius crocodyli]|uniref:DUF3306 domain-containing protein n=1 Tax=Rhodovarius crocodyli TaxID=1979269 RepID=UPI00197D6D99|nr:DUF3306 domain-containing protein [Rhodovarius crocodyli]